MFHGAVARDSGGASSASFAGCDLAGAADGGGGNACWANGDGGCSGGCECGWAD